MNMPHVPDESLIEGLARVVAVDGMQVWLVAEQAAACGSCATRSACGSGSTKPASRWRMPRSLGPDQALLALGEIVHIGVDRQALTRASLTAYTLPLLTMLMSASILQEAGDAMAIVGAILGLLVGVVVARVLARRWRNALAPVVLGRAQAAASCAPPKMPALRSIAIPVVQQRSL
ncbi:SoxR reducing system RseC family protein [Rhodoferax sp.]|uniref:SoxR reducing system RseC family protein n=1 Tax=Rhodoferax sp. TaxID=50421 RepID=UPI00263993D4|nr:SoxR reducing system RseC family protein [Rhodoferax sp.]MDD2809272.1 SoxR reducing system RseC family protein [Rhodoferax sp.]